MIFQRLISENESLGNRRRGRPRSQIDVGAMPWLGEIRQYLLSGRPHSLLVIGGRAHKNFRTIVTVANQLCESLRKLPTVVLRVKQQRPPNRFQVNAALDAINPAVIPV